MLMSERTATDIFIAEAFRQQALLLPPPHGTYVKIETRYAAFYIAHQPQAIAYVLGIAADYGVAGLLLSCSSPDDCPHLIGHNPVFQSEAHPFAEALPERYISLAAYLARIYPGQVFRSRPTWA